MPYSSNVWRECTPPESSAIGPDALKQIEARHAAAGAIGTILANATEFRQQLATGAAVTLQEGSLQ